MKIFVWPALMIITPLAVLFIITKLWPSILALPTWLKVFIGSFFIAAGLICSVYAIGLSLQGYKEAHIRCATGAVVFLPFALFTYFIGVPLVLGLMKGSGVRGR